MEFLGIFLLDTAAVSKIWMLKTMMLQGHFLTERLQVTLILLGIPTTSYKTLMWWMFPCFTFSKTLEANLMTCPPATVYRFNFPAEVVGSLWSWEIQYRFWWFQLGYHGCIKFGASDWISFKSVHGAWSSRVGTSTWWDRIVLHFCPTKNRKTSFSCWLRTTWQYYVAFCCRRSLSPAAQVLVVGQQMESSSGDGCRRMARSIHRCHSGQVKELMHEHSMGG